MKNSAGIVVIFIVMITQLCLGKGNSQDVPENVKESFKQKFPSIKKTKWDKENESEWEAEFNMNGKKYSANFSTNGEWLETEYEIRKSDIPEKVRIIMAHNFSKYKIEEAEIAETPSGKFYEFEIKQGKEEFEIVFDAQGNITSKKKIEEDEN